MSQQQTAVAKQQNNPPDVGRMLMDPKFKSQLAHALPKHMTADRMTRIVLTEIRKNPKLLQCDPMSLMGAVVQCSQLGLEPGSGLGQAFLIPRYNSKRRCLEATMLPGYKGLVDLARRSGRVLGLVAHCVYEKDEFEHEQGDEERIRHVAHRGSKKDRGAFIAVYAIARLLGGGIEREVMWKGDVDEIRDRFSHDNPVWKTDYDEMARKTALRKISKRLPLSPEMQRAIEADDNASSEDGQDNHLALVDLGIIDADYEPQSPISEDATTPAAINQEEAKKSEQRTQGDLKATFASVVGAKTKEGWKPDEIYAACGMKNGYDLPKMTAEQLIAAIEVVNSLSPKGEKK